MLAEDEITLTRAVCTPTWLRQPCVECQLLYRRPTRANPDSCLSSVQTTAPSMILAAVHERIVLLFATYSLSLAEACSRQAYYDEHMLH
jgi:hypothetical protein